jgi:hypothetical protein
MGVRVELKVHKVTAKHFIATPRFVIKQPLTDMLTEIKKYKYKVEGELG